MHVSRFTPAQAAERAAALKQKGTADFKQKGFAAAATKYSCGVDYATEAGSSADAALLPTLLLNEAQCRLQLQQPQEAAQLCSRVLEREPENVKALYRRALANLELAEFVEARRCASRGGRQAQEQVGGESGRERRERGRGRGSGGGRRRARVRLEATLCAVMCASSSTSFLLTCACLCLLCVWLRNAQGPDECREAAAE